MSSESCGAGSAPSSTATTAHRRSAVAHRQGDDLVAERLLHFLYVRPRAPSQDANVCRRSWNRKSPTPAAARPGHQMRHLVSAAPEKRSRLRLEMKLLHRAVVQRPVCGAPRFGDTGLPRGPGRTSGTRWPRNDRRSSGRPDDAGRSGGAWRRREIAHRRATDPRSINVDVLYVAICPRVQGWAAIANARAAAGHYQQGGD
jgi:hypothetical protein